MVNSDFSIRKKYKAAKVNHNDNIGKTFARLTVLSYRIRGKYVLYNCSCECGTVKDHYSFSVINGSSTSCGCYRKPNSAPRCDIKTGINSSAANAVWLSYKRNANQRGYCMELTKEELLTISIQDCHFCGSKPLMKRKGKTNAPTFEYNGVDRYDNNVGYTKYNCVAYCFICNRAKGTLNGYEFERWINMLQLRKVK